MLARISASVMPSGTNRNCRLELGRTHTRVVGRYAVQLDCIPERSSLQRLMLSLPSRHHLSQQVPESPSVVLLDGVAELVADDVALHTAGQFHHPGVMASGVMAVITQATQMPVLLSSLRVARKGLRHLT